MLNDIPSRLSALSHLGAGWILWLLIALSIVALAVALDRAIALGLSRRDAAACREDLMVLLRRGELAAARARAERSPSIEGQVVAAGLAEPGAGAAAAEQRMAGATGLAKLDLERRLAFLGTLGSNAPFVGLLGTVIGIIRAFHALDGSTGKVTAGLMTEVGSALIATAVGILVALPAVATFNLFQRLIRGRLVRVEALGRELVAALSAARPGATAERGA